MTNYQNSLGESELFGRMTAGFAKICESVQAGKFVRDGQGVICESCNEADENNQLPPPPAEIPLDGTPKADDGDGDTKDAGTTTDGETQAADVASATPEQINGSVTECGNAEQKPLKKLIPEGCCGGKAKKVLKEEVQKLCKTCGNPLDETGTCQDCQGYAPVKEGEGEIKLQVPASVQRRAELKVNAKANQEKVAQAIRDGKADGIVKEDEEEEKVEKKGSDKMTKDVVFGMLVNLLGQLRDGATVEDVTANPDMEEFDDYSLDEVLELAGKYLEAETEEEDKED